MPLIQVNMMQGRTPEQKRALLTAITDAVHQSIGAPIPSIRVWINELTPDGFITGGQMASDRQAEREAAAAAQANHGAPTAVATAAAGANGANGKDG